MATDRLMVTSWLWHGHYLTYISTPGNSNQRETPGWLGWSHRTQRHQVSFYTTKSRVPRKERASKGQKLVSLNSLLHRFRDLLVSWINDAFPVAAVANYHNLSGLKQEMYSLTVLKVRSLDAWCWQDHISSECSVKNPFFAFSSFWACCHSLTCSCVTGISAFTVTLSSLLCDHSPPGLF